MKCISRRVVSLILCMLLSVTFCGCEKERDDDAYRIYESSFQYGITRSSPLSATHLFADDLCVTGGEDIGTDEVDAQVAYAGGVFNDSTKEVLYSQSMFEKMYPASTTKILTCYLALEYGNLDDIYTVSEYACEQEKDSSVANLTPGDQVSLRALLYGLMIVSGNDAAIAIAEGISGTTDAFGELMNSKAHELGATNSHFVTPNGLHDEEHYTCVYDMYLIFHAAIADPEFVDIIKTTSYTADIVHADGTAEQIVWDTTNYYLTGKTKAPEGISVVGGKTGTTNPAGYCLVLLSKNENNDDIISIIFHADAKGNLYYLMNEMLYRFAGGDAAG